MNSRLACAPIKTGRGIFIAGYSERGLARLDFPGAPTRARPLIQPLSQDQRAWHRLTKLALNIALAGMNPDRLPPLDVTAGTDFQRSVWRQMQRLRAGQTASYGELATAVGKPGAARAVGAACGANQIPVLIPCHRVLAAAGRLGGFSGGLENKRALLANEGVAWKE